MTKSHGSPSAESTPQKRTTHASSAIKLHGSSASAVTAQRFIDYLYENSFTPGDKVPAERTLMTEFDVPRSTLREAISVLEVLGIVETRPGSGTYLRSTTSELLPETLSWSLLLSQHTFGDLLDVRTALEVEIARLAAARVSEELLEALGETLAEQRTALNAADHEEYVRADRDFHRQLSEACGNSSLEMLSSTVRSLTRVWRDRRVDSIEEIRKAYNEHRAIFTAVLGHDADAAADAMFAHMKSAKRRLMETLIAPQE